MEKPSKITKIVIFFLVTSANILLAQFAALTFSSAPGIITLYFAVAFMIVFTLWFGVWGAVAAYIGCLIGAGIPAGLPASVNLYWSLADLWQVLIPLLAFALLKADAALRTKRDFVVFLIFGWLLNNLAGAIWGAGTFVLSGQFHMSDFNNLFANWFLTNLIVTIIITPLLLRFFTPIIKKKGFLIRNL
jgi:hypothetical protein